MSVLKGVIVPIVTPLERGNQNRINVAAVEELCGFLISKGVSGLFPCGTTGEGFLLSKETRKELASLVVKTAKRRVPVIIQTGCIDTESTVELTKHARDIGADGAGVVSPYFYRYDLESLKHHFVAIACSAPELPIYLYNIPNSTNNDITPQLLRSIINETENVAGIKYSDFDLRRIPEYLSCLGESRTFLIGVDELIYPAYTLGASGCVAGNANVFPEPFVGLYHAFQKKDDLEAKKQQDLIIKIAEILKRGRQVCYFKKALKFRGIEVGDVISPQKSLDDREIADLYQELNGLGLPLEHPTQ